jgi:hypothetical protein
VAVWLYGVYACRILADDVSTKYRTLLVNAMSRCTLFLVSQSSSFNTDDLVHKFCVSTIQEYAKAQMIERLPAVCASMHLAAFLYSPNRSLGLLIYYDTNFPGCRSLARFALL